LHRHPGAVTPVCTASAVVLTVLAEFIRTLWQVTAMEFNISRSWND
jgi:hypothetical protein